MPKTKHKRRGDYLAAQNQKAMARKQAQQASQLHMLHPNGHLMHASHAEVSVRHHQGPLPAPEDLVQYNLATPDAADRIIAMAEKQAEHRQSLELLVVQTNSRNSTLGIMAGFLLGVFVIGGGFWLLFLGKSVEGFSAIIGAAATLVGTFIYGKHANKKELEQKRAGR